MTVSIKTLSPELLPYATKLDEDFCEIEVSPERIIRQMKSKDSSKNEIEKRLSLCEIGFLIQGFMNYYENSEEKISDLEMESANLESENLQKTALWEKYQTAIKVAEEYREKYENLKSDTLDLRFQRSLSNAEDFLHKHKISQ